jgi:hypothetical protein
MKTLRAGHFAGEFGWQLMCWQGIAREVASKGNYDNVVVGCEPQYQFLYEDFATDFIDFPYEVNTRNMWMTNDQVYPMSKANIAPSRKVCVDKTIKQNFIKLGKHNDSYTFDILIHARSTKNMNTGYRNWPLSLWTSLSEKYKGLSIASIGTIEGAMCVPGTIDIRDLELKQLADVMASSNMLVSPSSGPAHFASLCGLRHIVWSSSKTVGIMDNKKRYKEIWNPFKTECKFISRWQPTVTQACIGIDGWL